MSSTRQPDLQRPAGREVRLPSADPHPLPADPREYTASATTCPSVRDRVRRIELANYSPAGRGGRHDQRGPQPRAVAQARRGHPAADPRHRELAAGARNSRDQANTDLRNAVLDYLVDTGLPASRDGTMIRLPAWTPTRPPALPCRSRDRPGPGPEPTPAGFDAPNHAATNAATSAGWTRRCCQVAGAAEGLPVAPRTTPARTPTRPRA
jgi:hypothetical protein